MKTAGAGVNWQTAPIEDLMQVFTRKAEEFILLQESMKELAKDAKGTSASGLKEDASCHRNKFLCCLSSREYLKASGTFKITRSLNWFMGAEIENL